MTERQNWIDRLVHECPGARVPCSRYGWDTESCAPVAVDLAMCMAEATGEPLTYEHVSYCMGLVVNDHEDVAGVLLEHGLATPSGRELAEELAEAN